MALPLVDLIHRLGAVGFRYGNRAERHLTHKRLLECIRNHDAVGAEENIRLHLEMSLKAAASAEPNER